MDRHGTGNITAIGSIVQSVLEVTFLLNLFCCNTILTSLPEWSTLEKTRINAKFWFAAWPKIWLQLRNFASLRCQTPNWIQCISKLKTIYWCGLYQKWYFYSWSAEIHNYYYYYYYYYYHLSSTDKNCTLYFNEFEISLCYYTLCYFIIMFFLEFFSLLLKCRNTLLILKLYSPSWKMKMTFPNLIKCIVTCSN